MIMVQSTFQLSTQTRAEALDLMKNMVPLCRQEHGCLSYEYFEGLTDNNQVILLQEWEDADCLQGHYQTEHMENFLRKLGNYLESEVITRSYVSQEQKTAVSPTKGNLPSPEQTIH